MTRKEMITMKFKRLVTALLSATLMISLAACSGNEKPAESQTGEGTTAEAIHVNLAESWGFEYFYTIITPDVSSSTGCSTVLYSDSCIIYYCLFNSMASIQQNIYCCL